MVDLGVFVIVDMGIFIGGAVAFFVLAAQLLWMFLKDNLPYSTLITVIEWRPIVVWWIPLGLGVALGVGKSLLFKPRSG